jgi:hypothetical protein
LKSGGSIDDETGVEFTITHTFVDPPKRDGTILQLTTRRFPPPWSVEDLTDSADGAINERARAPLAAD